MPPDPFPGLAIGGYRSFGPEPQMLGPLSRIALVVGPNNTGKSNFLSLFYRHAAELREALIGGRHAESFSSTEDPHTVQGQEPPPAIVRWPLKTRDFPGPEYDGVAEVLAEPAFKFGTDRPWLQFRAPSVHGQWALDPEWIEQLLAEVDGGTWMALSERLTNTRGGGRGTDLTRVVEWLARSGLEEVPPTQFIPAHRQIRSGADASAPWTLDGAGLVNRLDQLKNAGFQDHADKRAYAAIREGLAALLDVDECDFVVPRDGSNDLQLIVDGEHRPLRSFGTGYEHALLIVAATVAFPDHLFCIEEPESHLHPKLQRQLGRHLRERTASQLLISTHSAHLIDALKEPVFRTRMVQKRTIISRPVDAEIIELIDDLGYRASDLLQANCIIWVEGPSDRIYVNAWITASAGERFVEGVHYVVMFYGGALLERLSALREGSDDGSRVPLRRMQQHFAVIGDSDRANEIDALKDRVLRVTEELEGNATGLLWVTKGRTIENYIPPEVLGAAIRATHPTVTSTPWTGDPGEAALQTLNKDGTALKAVDKVSVAEAAVAHGLNLEWLDLEDRVSEVIAFIEAAN